MSVSCLRVHDLVSGEVDPGGAHVVLVDRLWPRGVSKESFDHDEWCKDVAPSDDLRREFHHGEVDFDRFAERYREELSRNPAADEVARLTALATDGDLVLAYSAQDTEHNNAVVLADEIRANAR
ncbi:DUF488 domain-containing protein [Dietzia sp. ANT_WB102]|uniref:DUF488 domain-containing protein n=1 Tax=Dietzia sp. ANT_WB102 TaxID=2597345 RepID=UPI0011EBC1A9|nr:DUF488 family protein [Dietzia sp. ANT_WB102]KAA0918127.1 DUF488 family protein [Dietzia sp. ANT_WB102]